MDFEVYYIVFQRPKKEDTIVGGPYYSIHEAFSNLNKFESENFHRDHDYEVKKTTVKLSPLMEKN
jgi:hypothetical protein